MALYCFTVGYQGRSLDDLCAVLIDMGVKMLVDVRARAWSHRPAFRKSALKKGVEEAGLTYTHLKVAGNPFRPKKGERKSFATCAEQYRQHILSNPEILFATLELISKTDAALFCYEAASSECHRSILVEELRQIEPTLKVQDL